jgi:NADPH:quinone reductase-like Zn-dependent oxidoreductase
VFRLVTIEGAATVVVDGQKRDSDMNAMPRRTPMKAVTQDRYGSADVLRLHDIEQPTPGDHEVLVKVQAAGIARGVLHVMTGEPYLMRLMGFGLRKPKQPVPGQDVAGTVTAAGDGVTRFKVGDEVFGIAKGSFAEYALAHEDRLSHKPENLSFEHAAVMAISGLTALRALDVAGVTGGSKVLIVGASGGVGTYAVQIAVAMGATVTGVASGSKADLVTALGAQHVIDYSRDDFADGSQTYDVVVDIGGMTPVSRLRRTVQPKGTLVIVGGENGSKWSPGMGRQLKAAAMSPIVPQRLTSILAKQHYSGLDRLAKLAAAGAVAPCIERSYSLADVPDAVRQLEAGKVRGQIVITP